jgi:Mg2+ and Co2+ transporter CorA
MESGKHVSTLAGSYYFVRSSISLFQGLIVHSEEFKLIFQMLEKIDSKVDEMKDSLHQGTRRMDSFERKIELLEAADKATDADVKVLKKQMEELAPVRDVVTNIKRMLYGAVALMVVIQTIPFLKTLTK